MSHTERLAAHNAMRKAFSDWNPKADDLFDLAAALNAAAAKAIRSIKNARRD